MRLGAQRRRLPLCRSYSVLSGAAAALLGGFALLGWILESELLKSLRPDGIAMNPVTAVCFLLAGFALALRTRRPAAALAWAVVAVAGLRLCGYLGWDLGIDRLLFSSALDARGLPNRMAPNTAASFLLAGAALLLLERRVWAAHLLALAAGAAALMALLGYAYGAQRLYGLPAHIPMALNTAAAFFLLSTGLLCARPESGPMALLTSDTDAGLSARRLLPAAVLVPAALGWLHMRGEVGGLYGPEFGLSILVASTVAVLVLMIYWNALKLQALELRREEASSALERAHAELTRCVEERTTELVQTTRKYEELVELSPEAIFIQTEGRFAYVNTALLKLLGLASADEVVGKAVLEFVHPDSRDTVRARIEAVNEQRRSVSLVDALWVRADGKTVDVEVVASPFDLQGHAGAQVFVRDVTERKKLERQFLQVQKMEAVGRLAGGVAHDFNNLLTAICGYSAFLLQSLPLGDPRRADVEEIKKAGERAGELTRQLLAFSRKQVLRPAVVDLNEVVAGIERMLQRVIGEDIDLRTTLRPGLGRARADPGQLQQVLMNLVINSRDAMPRGGKVTVETSDVDLGADEARSGIQPGRYVLLAVSDTGQGMSAETLSHIFEPFFTTKELGKGTGLGLSTVYGIVKQSGGSVFVHSEPGRGTTFKVYLPRVDAPVDQHAAPASVASLRGSETVLLVEDDELVRRFAGRVLREHGYAVLDASGPEEALRLLEERPGEVSLLLSDLVMPGMTGHALAQKIRAERPRTKVLLMSGYADEAVVRHELLGGGADFLQKPLTAEGLARKVREALDAPAR